MEFYFSQNIHDKTIYLDEDETNHLVKVRRSVIGDQIHVTDGMGKLFIARLTGVEKKQAVLEIREIKTDTQKPPDLHLAIAPTKNADRMEWFLEKCVETGVGEITFLNCKHSERRIMKEERLRKVAVAAMKQSRKTCLPRLNPVTDFMTFISREFNGDKLLFSTRAAEKDTLGRNYHKGNPLTALIGPEGDFHAGEIDAALEAGFQLTSLGAARLRTETAGLAVCTIYNFMNA
jgi:16S rRNA (uracil1498-N3)-methyltransferase